MENRNAEGAGAPLQNTNAEGPHLAALETQKRINSDAEIERLQRNANCAEVPFNGEIKPKDQSEAMRQVFKALKAARRVVVCAVCDTINEESETQLLDSTMNQPPPESWLMHLQTTVHSILIEGSSNRKSLIRQYRVPKLTGMSPEWKKLLLSPRGIYPVSSQGDTTVPDTCVYPQGSCDEMHVDKQVTQASFAKACVCTTCEKSLRMTTQAPQGHLPQFACANDLCIGTRISTPTFLFYMRMMTGDIRIQTWRIRTILTVSYLSRVVTYCFGGTTIRCTTGRVGNVLARRVETPHTSREFHLHQASTKFSGYNFCAQCTYHEHQHWHHYDINTVASRARRSRLSQSRSDRRARDGVWWRRRTAFG